MSLIFIVSISTFALGLLAFVVGLVLQKISLRRRVEEEARQIIQDAEESAQQLIADHKTRGEEYSKMAFRRFEKEGKRTESRIQQLESKIREREERLNQQIEVKHEAFQKEQAVIKNWENLVLTQEKQYELQQRQKIELTNQLIEQLEQKTGFDRNTEKAQLVDELVKEANHRTTKWLQEAEEEFQMELERRARRAINSVIHRFARPYCPERGIGYITFSDARTRDRVLGPDQSHLRIVEEICGVDLVYREDLNTVSVSGFDPVRREWARASLERLTRDKRVDADRVKNIVERTKRELFRKIREDGHSIAKELGLSDLHPEIKNMMGALRYRYSFAQNQYFHCGEVGFLCGLLSSELKLDLFKGRRAGMLHDIGKAMDHSLEGGHAVIGADFIAKHGESDPIVHAVRAHHYDEHPKTDLAYLVIAADAISGARPGARRSTADSYLQKMGQLEQIGNSFEGVTSTYILSAGREVRVMVDSAKVDDQKALDLSREIAEKIEEECSYPGLIKVTIVRETNAVQMAR